MLNPAKVPQLVQKTKRLIQRLNHLLAFFPLSQRRTIFLEQLPQIDVFSVQLCNQFSLTQRFSLVDQESHNRLGHHVAHRLAHSVKVRHNQRLDDVHL